MPNSITTSFNGGELSPRMLGRFDSPLYARGLKFCENYMIHPQGPVLRRAGTALRKTLDYDARRIIRFRTVSGEDYAVVFSDGKIHLYSVSGDAVEAQFVGQQQMFENGDFSIAYGGGWMVWEDSYTGWHDLTTIPPPDLRLTPFYESGGLEDHGPADYCGLGAGYYARSIYQKITLTVASDIKISVDILGYREVPPIGGDPANFRIDIDSVLADPPTDGDVYHWEGRPDPGTSTFEVYDLDPGDYWIRIGTDYLLGHGLDIDNLSLTANAVLTGYEIDTPWSAAEIADVQYDIDTGNDLMILVHGSHNPYYLKYNAATAWDFAAIVFGSKPATWTGSNWPATVAIHAGRAYYGGTPSHRNRLWASRSGTLYDMAMATGPGGTQLPGDAMDYDIATAGGIEWLRSFRSLLVGTDLGEYSVNGSKGVPLNGDIAIRPESGYGSISKRQAISAGNMVLYPSAPTKIRAAAFEFQSGGFESADLNFYAEHILADGIKELHHVYIPEGVIFCLTEAGTLRSCTFEPREQVIAWYRYAFPDAEIRSCAPFTSAGKAQLLMLMERNGTVFIEQLALTENIVEGYLDAFIQVEPDDDGVITGLSHLEGCTVQACTSTALIGEYEVAGGLIMVDPAWAHKAVMVGIAYDATCVTLPKLPKEGKIRNSKVGLILNNSALPLVNGQRFPDRTPSTPMNEGEPLITGKRKIVNPLRWDDEGCNTIMQDKPFRTEILAIYEAILSSEVNA